MNTGLRISPIVFSLLLSLAVAGCNRSRSKPGEPAYISAPQVNLRDRVAAIYNKQGIVRNGDRVEILDRDRRFARVRTATGTEGWVEQTLSGDAGVSTMDFRSSRNLTRIPPSREPPPRATIPICTSNRVATPSIFTR